METGTHRHVASGERELFIVSKHNSPAWSMIQGWNTSQIISEAKSIKWDIQVNSRSMASGCKVFFSFQRDKTTHPGWLCSRHHASLFRVFLLLHSSKQIGLKFALNCPHNRYLVDWIWLVNGHFSVIVAARIWQYKRQLKSSSSSSCRRQNVLLEAAVTREPADPKVSCTSIWWKVPVTINLSPRRAQAASNIRSICFLKVNTRKKERKKHESDGERERDWSVCDGLHQIQDIERQ